MFIPCLRLLAVTVSGSRHQVGWTGFMHGRRQKVKNPSKTSEMLCGGGLTSCVVINLGPALLLKDSTAERLGLPWMGGDYPDWQRALVIDPAHRLCGMGIRLVPFGNPVEPLLRS